MRNYIILTKIQANLIRGGYGQRPDGTYQARIEPVELPDGKWAIPEVCASSELLKEAHERVRDLKKICEVQDIQDLGEGKMVSHLEKDKYYLSKEYWVVKALESKSMTLVNGAKLTDMPSTFQIRSDIGTAIDEVKLEVNKLSVSKGLSLFNYSKPVTNLKGEETSRWQLFKDMCRELWRRITYKIVTFVKKLFGRCRG